MSSEPAPQFASLTESQRALLLGAGEDADGLRVGQTTILTVQAPVAEAAWFDLEGPDHVWSAVHPGGLSQFGGNWFTPGRVKMHWSGIGAALFILRCYVGIDRTKPMRSPFRFRCALGLKVSNLVGRYELGAVSVVLPAREGPITAELSGPLGMKWTFGGCEITALTAQPASTRLAREE